MDIFVSPAGRKLLSEYTTFPYTMRQFVLWIHPIEIIKIMIQRIYIIESSIPNNQTILIYPSSFDVWA